MDLQKNHAHLFLQVSIKFLVSHKKKPKDLLPKTLLLVVGVVRDPVGVPDGPTFGLKKSSVGSSPRLPLRPPRFGGFLRFNTSLNRLKDKGPPTLYTFGKCFSLQYIIYNINA